MRSSTSTRQLNRRGTGPPVFTYEQVPGVPSVSVMRLDRGSMADIETGHAHAHDFLLLAYFDRGGGSLRLGGREWRVESGDVYLVAPGAVIGVGDDADGLADAAAWGVFFPPEGLGPRAPDALLTWHAHPLLFPFVQGAASGARRLRVPVADRRAWSERLQALERELRERRDGYHDAASAHLTLLLVAVARLAVDVAGDLRLEDEPLLADVFAYIEAHYASGISLKDVASAVAISPGHLTTTVRRKTGRTVLEWIVERRMAQARRLLVETDLPVDAVAAAVGYGDVAYFIRSFRRAHDTTPLRWRRAGRS